MRRIATWLLCSIVIAWPLSTAFADSKNLQKLLRGTYHVTAVNSCVDAVGGFSDPELQVIDPSLGVSNEIAHISGSITFDGVGNAVETSTAMFMSFVTTNVNSVGTVSNTCNYGYTVNSDRSFTLQGDCAGIIEEHIANGATFLITGFKKKGFIGSRAKILLVSMIEANEQELFVDGVFATKRMCSRTETLMRVNKREHDDDDD